MSLVSPYKQALKGGQTLGVILMNQASHPHLPGKPLLFRGDPRFWEKNGAAGFSLRKITHACRSLERSLKAAATFGAPVLAGARHISLVSRYKQVLKGCETWVVILLNQASRPYLPGKPLIFRGDPRFWEKTVAAGFSLRKITPCLPFPGAQPQGCGYI